MLRQLLPALRATLALALLTGLLFPMSITGIAQAVLPRQAAGSLVRGPDGRVIGSGLIGQSFTKIGYFHPRPSAAGSGYAAEASGGTNLGPTSAKLLQGLPDDPATKDSDEYYAGVKQLAETYRRTNDLPPDAKVPVDAVTRSGSGLDPHISPVNALLQARRVARSRGADTSRVVRLVRIHTRGRDLGVLGEPRVNVLALNLALDRELGSSRPAAHPPLGESIPETRSVSRAGLEGAER